MGNLSQLSGYHNSDDQRWIMDLQAEFSEKRPVWLLLVPSSALFKRAGAFRHKLWQFPHLLASLSLDFFGGTPRARLDAAQDESPQICRRCQTRLKTPKSLPCTTTAEARLTSTREYAIVEDMNRARLPRVPLGGGLSVPGLVSGRQALEPVDKPAGGGRSYHCRGGSGRHVGSLLGGAFKPSRLAGGCGWLPALSEARADSRLRGFGKGFAWRAQRARLSAASGPAWRTAPFGACEHFTRFGRDRRPLPAAGPCLE